LGRRHGDNPGYPVTEAGVSYQYLDPALITTDGHDTRRKRQRIVNCHGKRQRPKVVDTWGPAIF